MNTQKKTSAITWPVTPFDCCCTTTDAGGLETPRCLLSKNVTVEQLKVCCSEPSKPIKAGKPMKCSELMTTEDYEETFPQIKFFCFNPHSKFPRDHRKSKSNSKPPPLLASDYCVVIEKSASQKWGIDVEIVDNDSVPIMAVVRTVHSGAIKSFNDSAPAEQKIQEGDAIIEVNGVRNNMLALLMGIKDICALHMTLRRPTEVRVSVTRKGRPLGLDLYPRVSDFGLLVKEVSDGALANSDVMEGDFIVQVNNESGKSGTPMALMQKIMDAEELHLLIMRYPGPVKKPSISRASTKSGFEQCDSRTSTKSGFEQCDSRTSTKSGYEQSQSRTSTKSGVEQCHSRTQSGVEPSYSRTSWVNKALQAPLRKVGRNKATQGPKKGGA